MSSRRDFLKGAGAAGALFALDKAPHANTHNSGAAWTIQATQTDDPVEQQTPQGATQPDRSLWVLNTTGPVDDPPFAGTWRRIWDPDEEADGAFIGTYLDPGTITGRIGIVGDDSPHLAYLTIPADKPGLHGTISLGYYLTLDVEPGQTAAILGPQHQHPTSLNPSVYDDPRLLEIPNSNGGRGELLDVEFTLTNTTSKRIRDILVWGKVVTVLGWNAAPVPNPLFSHGTPLYPIGSYPQVWSWIG